MASVPMLTDLPSDVRSAVAVDSPASDIYSQLDVESYCYY